MIEYKMHRAVKIATGEVTEVSDVLANDPDMLLAYGFMLQPLTKEEIDEELEKESDKLPTVVLVNPINDEAVEFEVEELDGVFAFKALTNDHIAFPSDYNFQEEIRNALPIVEAKSPKAKKEVVKQAPKANK